MKMKVFTYARVLLVFQTVLLIMCLYFNRTGYKIPFMPKKVYMFLQVHHQEKVNSVFYNDLNKLRSSVNLFYDIVIVVLNDISSQQTYPELLLKFGKSQLAKRDDRDCIIPINATDMISQMSTITLQIKALKTAILEHNDAETNKCRIFLNIFPCTASLDEQHQLYFFQPEKCEKWMSNKTKNVHYKFVKDDIDVYGTNWISAVQEPRIREQELKHLKIYYDGPIVVPKYKLIFFWFSKTASTYWKLLLAYIQGIILEPSHHSVHRPGRNGLRYLHDYSDQEVIKMMLNDSWLKVIFVREPRERVLSAYLNKVKADGLLPCKNNITTFANFLEIFDKCTNDHWQPQVRLPRHYYENMIIGKMENIATFTKQLFQRIGAWTNDVQQLLGSNKYSVTTAHATNASSKLCKYYTCELEKKVLSVHKLDYEIFLYDNSIICAKHC